MTVTSPDTLAARCTWLRARLEALPSLTSATREAGSDWIAVRTRRAQALDAVCDLMRAMPDRPRIEDKGHVGRVTMLGIAATSTMGIDGALFNWLVRAERAARVA
jgi:hypothetical protein